MSDALKLVLLLKLLLATLLGGAIGFEREIAGKPAGLRTNILICVGAALFTHLSISVAQIGFTPDGRPYGDTTRITAQIVSGIGPWVRRYRCSAVQGVVNAPGSSTLIATSSVLPSSTMR